MASQTTSWGPLAEPVHGPVPDGMPPWKDNAYLAFWDPQAGVYGAFHVSTSPNAEGRRARFSVQTPAGLAEVIEDLDPGTFSSASISFDLDSSIRVDHPDLTAELTVTPLYTPADYSRNGLLPDLVEGEPLQHFQQAAQVRGTVAGIEVTGHGVRDRTWGYRDESVSFMEYIGMLAVFDGFAFTCMAFMAPDGSTKTEGFHLSDDGVQLLDSMSVTRDASGLYAAGTFGGEVTMEVRTAERLAGIWVPMGWERCGPTMAAYDEFLHLRMPDGREGHALVEQGQIRRIF